MQVIKLYGPTGRPISNTLIGPEIYNSPNTTYKFDLAKAAALLDEAGWKLSNGNPIRSKAMVIPSGVKMVSS